MATQTWSTSRKYRAYQRKDIDEIAGLWSVPSEEKEAMMAVSAVLPFRVNGYVLDELIDWSQVPDDPIYQLTFPQRGMLEPHQLERMIGLLRSAASDHEIQSAARGIQLELNPHPAGQMELNVPTIGGRRLAGMQHKGLSSIRPGPGPGTGTGPDPGRAWRRVVDWISRVSISTTRLRSFRASSTASRSASLRLRQV